MLPLLASLPEVVTRAALPLPALLAKVVTRATLPLLASPADGCHLKRWRSRGRTSEEIEEDVVHVAVGWGTRVVTSKS